VTLLCSRNVSSWFQGSKLTNQWVICSLKRVKWKFRCHWIWRPNTLIKHRMAWFRDRLCLYLPVILLMKCTSISTRARMSCIECSSIEFTCWNWRMWNGSLGASFNWIAVLSHCWGVICFLMVNSVLSHRALSNQSDLVNTCLRWKNRSMLSIKFFRSSARAERLLLWDQFA